MTTSSLLSPLRGIIPPMVTPLKSQDELDQAGLERLIEHILAGGVHGLFVLGTTGEAPSLSHRVRREVVTCTCQQVMRISTGLYGVGHFSSSYLKGLKCALSIKDICNDFMAEPFHRFRAPERQRIQNILTELDQLV